MSGGIERADGSRGSSTFPRAWGLPPGDQFSEERASWVRDRVREYRRGTRLEELATLDRRLLTILRRADLNRRREP